MKRGNLCNTTDLVEIWDSIDDNLKLKDKQCKSARMIILGANPRNPSICTNATDDLPNCTKTLCSFITQKCPQAQFNVSSIRSNADKGPHRDLHNGPEDSFIQILEPPKTGGNLWVADAKGSCSMTIHGTKVQGKVVDCTNQPFLFPSKSKLHATEPWLGDRRIVLVAWCTLSLDYSLCARLHADFGFPIPSRASKPVPQLSLQQAFESAEQHRKQQEALGEGITFHVQSSSSSDTHDSSQSQPEPVPSLPKDKQQPHASPESPFTPTVPDDDN